MIARLSEGGRGLAIMQACVDDVTLSSGPGRSTVVSLEKRMEWRAGGLLSRPAQFDPHLASGQLREGQLRDAG